jgi:hypothetical protein
MAGPDRAAWKLEADKEIRKLITGTSTIKPILKHNVPDSGRGDITYYNPQVKEKIKDGVIMRRARGTIGGDKFNYPGVVSARTASLEVVRAVFNSILADEADWMYIDITDYYLNTPLKRKEYMRMTRKRLSLTIMAKYELDQYFDNDVIHFAVNKRMYGLPQAGLLAQDRLIAHLAKYDYLQSTTVPYLFSHRTNGVTSS